MTNKQRAAEFLTDLVAGRIDQAFEKYVDMGGRHHNIYTPAGFAALKDGMIANEAAFPDKMFEIIHIAADENLVMVHSKLKLSGETPMMAVVHVLRFKTGKIVEMWDLSAQEPDEMPNADGMF